MYPITDYPKTKCVFERETINNRYIVTPHILEEMGWVFEEEVRAVDKLHGTNLSVHFKDGNVIAVDNRKNRVFTHDFHINGDFDFLQSEAILGICNAIKKGWL